MTQEQKITIQKLHKAYVENSKEYAAYDADEICSFNTFRNETNIDDKHIVVTWCRVKGLSEIFTPRTEIINYLIEPQGYLYDMSMLPELFPTESSAIGYIQKLKKFNYNEE